MPEPYSPTPLISASESSRLADLRALEMLDTPAEEPFDGIVEIAAALFDVPIALLGFVDADRHWFKANVGAPMRENPRAFSFCTHTILGTDILVVEDATQDARFADLPCVVNWPGVRAYAGVPLVTHRNEAVGTLCVLDTKPREFPPESRRLLERLAHQAVETLEMRRLLREVTDGLRRTSSD